MCWQSTNSQCWFDISGRISRCIIDRMHYFKSTFSNCSGEIYCQWTLRAFRTIGLENFVPNWNVGIRAWIADVYSPRTWYRCIYMHHAIAGPIRCNCTARLIKNTDTSGKLPNVKRLAENYPINRTDEIYCDVDRLYNAINCFAWLIDCVAPLMGTLGWFLAV